MSMEEPLITISNLRYKELLDKEIKADANKYELIMPMKYGNWYFVFNVYNKDESIIKGTPGELLESLNDALAEVKEFVLKHYSKPVEIPKRYLEYEKFSDKYSNIIEKLNNNKLYKILCYLKLL
jgi:hypothetical protein